MVMRHVAHRAAQLLLILTEDVRPRSREPDPTDIEEEPGSMEAH
jgi:hypothetical protein